MLDTRSRELAIAMVLMHFVELMTGSVGKNFVTRGGNFTLHNEGINYGNKLRERQHRLKINLTYLQLASLSRSSEWEREEVSFRFWDFH